LLKARVIIYSYDVHVRLLPPEPWSSTKVYSGRGGRHGYAIKCLRPGFHLSGKRVNQDLHSKSPSTETFQSGILCRIESSRTFMNRRYIAAKLFFVLSALCAVVGIILFRRDAIGSGLTAKDYANPLFLLMIPRLIPFTASILSASFGLAYFGFEKKFKRPANIPLVWVHLTALLFAILGHATLVDFWWRVLGDEHANIPLPLWASLLMIVAFAICFVAFGVNIFWSMSRTPLDSNNAS
jgi:hypothetical protein